jgi:hypothetical protein
VVGRINHDLRCALFRRSTMFLPVGFWMRQLESKAIRLAWLFAMLGIVTLIVFTVPNHFLMNLLAMVVILLMGTPLMYVTLRDIVRQLRELL